MRLITHIAAASFLLWPTISHACARPVFSFAPGSYHLTSDDAGMIDFALDEYKASRGDKLSLKVNVLQTGERQRNVRLARLRAEAVKTALVRRGVPSKSIVILTRKTTNSAEARVVDVDLIEGSTCS